MPEGTALEYNGPLSHSGCVSEYGRFEQSLRVNGLKPEELNALLSIDVLGNLCRVVD